MIFKTKQTKIKSKEQLKEKFEKTAQEEFFSHGDFKKLLKYQSKILIKNLELTKNDTVLDLACGYGFQLAKVANLVKNGLGVDWATTLIKKAKNYQKNQTNISFSELAVENLNTLEKKFTKIYSIGAFEHFTNHPKICKDIHNRLTQNGKFMILTQNKSAIWHFLSHYSSHGLKHNSTDTFFTKKELKTLFKSSGFKTIKIGYWNFVPKGDIHYPFNTVFQYIEKIIGVILPQFCKGGLYIVGSK